MFFILTKKAIIWKRFLPRLSNIQQPLAPLPPSSAYNLRSLSAIDIERIVTRAISLDSNFRKDRITPFRSYDVQTHYMIQHMALLPGGHYLVASVRTRPGEYGLMVWAMEHHLQHRPVPIAFRHTEVKAYSLQARYMTIQGQKGICVAFLRKKHKVKGDPRYM